MESQGGYQVRITRSNSLRKDKEDEFDIFKSQIITSKKECSDLDLLIGEKRLNLFKQESVECQNLTPGVPKTTDFKLGESTKYNYTTPVPPSPNLFETEFCFGGKASSFMNAIEKR